MNACTHSTHDMLRANPAAFRAMVRPTFRALSVDDAGHDTTYVYGNCRACASTIGIPASEFDRRNLHEETARAAKVATILALIPSTATRAEHEAFVGVLESWTKEQRSRFAAAAGVDHGPSDLTWMLVVHGVRSRVDALDAAEKIARAFAGERAAEREPERAS